MGDLVFEEEDDSESGRDALLGSGHPASVIDQDIAAILRSSSISPRPLPFKPPPHRRPRVEPSPIIFASLDDSDPDIGTRADNDFDVDRFIREFKAPEDIPGLRRRMAPLSTSAALLEEADALLAELGKSLGDAH
jgi:hypothetical protein